MQKHTKIYFDAFGYAEGDFVPSELSGLRGNNIHHIKCRGRGGNPSGDKDRIENLMSITMEEDVKYGDKEQYLSFLYQKHKNFLEFNGVPYNESYLNAQIEKYSLVCS